MSFSVIGQPSPNAHGDPRAMRRETPTSNPITTNVGGAPDKAHAVTAVAGGLPKSTNLTLNRKQERQDGDRPVL